MADVEGKIDAAEVNRLKRSRRRWFLFHLAGGCPPRLFQGTAAKVRGQDVKNRDSIGQEEASSLLHS